MNPEPVAVDFSRLAGPARRQSRRPDGSLPMAVWVLGGCVLAATALGCGGNMNRPVLPTGEVDADRVLWERGTTALEDGDWRRAREYFVQIRDQYPQSEYRPGARLSIGDTYEGEGTSASYVQAIGEYQDFLSLFPIHARAAYAQYKLGLVHFHQMRRAERDQTETMDAIREFETFITLYPTDALLPEARARLREARDRLSAHDFLVGRYYFRNKNYAGAISRFREILDDDPAYSDRDEVYFYLAESFATGNAVAEAIPYFARLLDEFESSEYAEEARIRMAELEAGEER